MEEGRPEGVRKVTVPPERRSDVPVRPVDDRPPSAGLGRRVSATILALAGWLAFAILWLSFYASEWSIYRNLAIFLVSLVVLFGILGAVWAGFGMRMRRMYDPGRDWYRPAGLRRGRWARRTVWLGWAVFFILWLVYCADDFGGYQNLAVLIASLLVAGGLSAATRTVPAR